MDLGVVRVPSGRCRRRCPMDDVDMSSHLHIGLSFTKGDGCVFVLLLPPGEADRPLHACWGDGDPKTTVDREEKKHWISEGQGSLLLHLHAMLPLHCISVGRYVVHTIPRLLCGSPAVRRWSPNKTSRTCKRSASMHYPCMPAVDGGASCGRRTGIMISFHVKGRPYVHIHVLQLADWSC